MPKFGSNDDSQNQSQFKSTSGFHFSAVNLNKLGASEYSLFGLAADCSSSVEPFAKEIEACVVETVKGCQRSPRADNMLVRYMTFATRPQEQHGFRPLNDCHPDSYKGSIQPGGTTALYDTSTDLIDSLAAYGKHLVQHDYTTNGIVVIITDGMDVGSSLTAASVKDAIARAKMSESLESLVTILIGINVQDSRVSDFLKRFKDEAGIGQYIEAKDASEKTLAKVAGFISKSVSSQSQSLGTGGASQPISF